MKRLLLSLMFLALCAGAFATEGDPKADPAATVVCGNARFTVLTDRLIRMEWAADGIFEDRASLAIINRRLPVPAFKAVRQGDGVTITTKSVKLVYRGGGNFTADNLEVSFKLNGKKVTWKPGMKDEGNLKGTSRTLDRFRGYNNKKSKKTLENGVVSRDGWAIVDESERHILVKDDSDWGEWVACRPEGERSDLYIFAYGHDYLAAVSDYIKVAGKIPMPPKYTFGYWWCRYFAYTDDQILEIAGEIRKRDIPADVFIIDMDWHYTLKGLNERRGKDEFGQRRGWTGYSWNHDLIQDPEGLLADLHAMHYKTSLNLHPASGIRVMEDCYDDFVKDYLSRTSDYDGPEGYIYKEGGYQFAGLKKPVGKAGYHAPVPYRMDQQAWADAYFNSVIHPLEAQGVDFWWLDWQQWGKSRYVPGLNNTFWINYAFFNDKVRRTKSLGDDAPRPFIYHRWGGLGSHRYQLGFSGDTYPTWEVLGDLVHFTFTASNVGYGYWGHDIGGHYGVEGKRTDPEIYTRWMQYGVFTPIFKTHCSTSELLERRIWEFPTHYEYLKAAMELRYALSPYIYNASREAYDTGISMCRPLYYYYPEEENAYSWRQEFLFGDDILATAVCNPADSLTGLSERKMWFPKGNDWYDMAHHEMHRGGSVKTLYYSISENPWYPRAGSVIPLARTGILNLQEPSDAFRILVVPGSGKSSCRYYEDDGNTQNYRHQYGSTLISRETSGRKTVITVSPREGDFKGSLPTRTIGLVLEGVKNLPASVKVNDTALDKSAFKAGENAVTVSLPTAPVNKTQRIEITL